MNRTVRVITCPFCLKQCVANRHINVICECGAKYYINTHEFWDRKNGKIVRNIPFELVEIDG